MLRFQACGIAEMRSLSGVPMMATKSKPRVVDTSYHRRRLAKRLQDPEFRREYEKAKAEIAQVDNIIRTLDELREGLGISKAELARRIGKDPAAIRRLFTASANPELKTVAALANAMDAHIEVVSARNAGRNPRKKRAARSA
jgi:ribosome-binding protein aMBF1 (putative translation factor)